MTKRRNDSFLTGLRTRQLKNVVVREACDQEGRKLGLIIQPHNGSEAGIISAAEAATDRMYLEFAMPSNVESRICATDASGTSSLVN